MATLQLLVLLEQQLNQAISELISTHAPSCSFEDVEDISDVYQERLEYNYWVDEQRYIISKLEMDIVQCKRELDPESLEAYNNWQSLKEDADLSAYESQTYE
jgi:hypothetical protein